MLLFKCLLHESLFSHRNAGDLSTTPGKKRKGGTAGLDFHDPNREAKKQSRAARFLTKRTEPLVLNINAVELPNGAQDGLSWDDCPIVGTCQDITKIYLRLTCAPDPSTVRPVSVSQQWWVFIIILFITFFFTGQETFPIDSKFHPSRLGVSALCYNMQVVFSGSATPFVNLTSANIWCYTVSSVFLFKVLRKSLTAVKAHWKANHDYQYACEQMKSIRQDLTVRTIQLFILNLCFFISIPVCVLI